MASADLLPQRPLGGDGLWSSPLGIGCMEMSVHYGLRDPEEGRRCIRRAVDLGVTLFDTADVYGPFVNEELVGRALSPVRDQVNVSTKVGLVHTPHGLRPRGSPDHIEASCDGSLRRMGVDHLDLWYLHRPDPAVPIEETVCPLGQGFLTGSIRSPDQLGADDIRRDRAWFQGDNFARNRDLADAVREVAAESGCSPAQLALAWLLAQGDDVFPIPGTDRLAYLEENVAACRVVLARGVLDQLDVLCAPYAVAGARSGGPVTNDIKEAHP